MSEPRPLYVNSVYFHALRMDVARLERQIHHDIDNYGMDMSEELIEALKALEKASRGAKKQMQAESEKYSNKQV